MSADADGLGGGTGGGDGTPRRTHADKTKYSTTSLAMNDEESARLGRLRKRLKMPMNKVVHLSLQWMEHLLDAQAAGKKVKVDEEVLVILLPTSAAPR